MSATNGGYGRGRPRFTPEERREILADLDAGESMRSIAARHGCTAGAIYYHAVTTLRHIPRRDRYAITPSTAGSRHSCSRCGIPTRTAGMCRDCLEVDQ